MLSNPSGAIQGAEYVPRKTATTVNQETFLSL